MPSRSEKPFPRLLRALARPLFSRKGRLVLVAGLLLVAGCSLFGGETSDDALVTPKPSDTAGVDSTGTTDSTDTSRTDSTQPPPVATDSLVVLKWPARPAGLHLDSTYAITWDTAKPPRGSLVRIGLCHRDDLITWITPFIANTGSYVLNFPNLLRENAYAFGSGEGYRLKMTANNFTDVVGYSAWFRIRSNLSGTLELSSPTRDSTAHLDSTLTVAWAHGDSSGATLGLQLLQENRILANVATYIPNTGSFLWTAIPTAFGFGETFRLRLFSMHDPAIADTSEPFRIAPAPVPQLTFTFPTSADTLKTKTPVTVAWRTDRPLRSPGRIDLYRDSAWVMILRDALPLDTGAWTWTPDSTLISDNRYRLRLASTTSKWDGYSQPFRIAGRGPDAYERDDSLRLAKILPPDSTPQAHNSSPTDVDWLTFAAKPGHYYVAEVTAQGPMTAGFRDSDGFISGSESSGLSFKLFLLPKQAGPAYLRLVANSGYAEYTVRLFERDWTSWSARSPFTEPGGKAVWKTGETRTLRYRPDSLVYGNALQFELYRDSLPALTLSTFSANTGTYNWSVPLTLESSSRYRLRMSSVTDARIFSFSDTFSIEGLVEDAYEPDDLMQTSRPLRAGDPAQSRTANFNDPDWLTFRTEANTSYYVLVDAKNQSVNAALFDSTGVSLTSNAGYRLVLTYPSLQANRVYSVRVITSALTTPYTVRLLAIESKTKDQGTAYRVFQSPDSSSTVQAGGTTTLSWDPDSAALGTAVTLYLAKDTATLMNISFSVANTGRYTWTVPAGIATGSDYRVGLVSGLHSGITSLSPAFRIAGLDPDAYEPDRQMTEAKTLLNGETQSRTLTYADEDWLSFQGKPDSGYLFAVNAEASTSLYITDSTGFIVASQAGTRFQLAYKPSVAGSYYLRVVAPFPGQTLGYTVGMKSVDLASSGLPVSFTSPDSSTIWASGNSYPVTWIPDTISFSRYIQMALYQDTVLVTSWTGVPNSGTMSVLLPAGLASSGKYRLRMANSTYPFVFGTSTNFSISGIFPDSLEPNESAAAAKTLGVNSARMPLTLSYRDSDWFRFAAKAQRLYQFRSVQPTGVYQNFGIWSASGSTSLASQAMTTSDTVHSLPWFCPTDGDYAFSVHPYSTNGSYLGDYALEIRELDADGYRLQVIAPKADTVARLGRNFTVTWTDPAEVKGSVDLFLYTAQGVVQTIAAGIANSGSYAWPVPASLPARKDYFIRIVSRWNAAVNGSSSPFEIAAP